MMHPSLQKVHFTFISSKEEWVIKGNNNQFCKIKGFKVGLGKWFEFSSTSKAILCHLIKSLQI